MLCHFFFRYKTVPLDAWHVEITHNKITKINKSALYFCGFPTLKHIKHKVKDFSLPAFQLYVADNYVRAQVLCAVLFLPSSILKKVVYKCFSKAAMERT